MLNATQPLLSICIPTWNRAGYLETCLRSVSEELKRCPNASVEVVISDNASTDGTQALCDSFVRQNPKFRYFRNLENIGGHRNIDLVVTRAQGIYCWYLGDDDALLPGSLQIVLDHLPEKRDIYLSWAIETDGDLRPLAESAYWYNEPMQRMTYDLGDPDDFTEYASKCRYMAGLFAFISILVFRKDRWEEQADLRQKLGATEYSHMISLMGMTRRSCPFRFIPDPLVYKRLGNDRWAAEEPWHRMFGDVLSWMQFALEICRFNPPAYDAFIGVIRRNHTTGIITGLRRTHNESDWAAAKHWLLAAGYEPVLVEAIDLGWKLFTQNTTPAPCLRSDSLRLADRELLLRGARKITVLASGSVSDQLVAVGVLSFLSTCFPTAQVQMLAPESNGQLLAQCPLDLYFIGINESLLGRDKHYLVDLSQKVRDFGSEVVLNLSSQREFALDILASHAPAAVRLAFAGAESMTPAPVKTTFDGLYDQPFEDVGNPIDRLNNFRAAFGLPSATALPKPWLSEADEAFAEQLFAEQDWPEHGLVVFAPGSGDYASQAWAEAIEKAFDSRSYSLIAMGSEQDRSAVAAQLQRLQETNVMDLTGHLSLGQMASLICRSRLVLAAEGPAAHLACAFGIPNVVVSGGGSFALTFPYSNLTTMVVRPLECFFCAWNCAHAFTCIQGLKAATICKGIAITLRGSEEVPRVIAQMEGDGQPAPMDLAPLLNHEICRLIRTDHSPETASCQK